MIFKNLNDIEQKELVPGFKVRFIHSENMTFAYWDIKKGSLLPDHSHPHEQVVTMMEGKFELTVENEIKLIQNGDVVVIPSNATHSGKAITNSKILDVFYPIRKDYQSK